MQCAVAILVALLAGATIGLGHGDWLVTVAAVTVGAVALGVLTAKAIEQPVLLVNWCVGAAIFLMPLNALRPIPSATYSDLVMTAAIPLTAVAVMSRHERLRLPAWLVGGGALLATSILLVELFPVRVLPTSDVFINRNLTTGEQDSTSSLILGVRLLFAVLVVPTTIALSTTTWHQVRGLANAWIAGVAVSSVVAALAAFGGLDLQEALTGGRYFIAAFQGQPGRYAGLTVHYGALGITVGMACPLIFARMTTLRRAVSYSPLLALFVAAALISGSRIGIITIVAGGLLVVAWQQRARRQVALLIAVGAVSVVIVAGSASLATIERLSGSSATAAESNANRLRVYREGLRLFLDRPVTGYGYQAVRGAHNTAFQLLNAGGLLALIGYYMVIGGVLTRARRIHKALPDEVAADALGFLISIVVLLLSSTVASAILDRYLYIPVALLLAIVLIERSQVVRHPQTQAY